MANKLVNISDDVYISKYFFLKSVEIFKLNLNDSNVLGLGYS